MLLGGAGGMDVPKTWKGRHSISLVMLHVKISFIFCIYFLYLSKGGFSPQV